MLHTLLFIIQINVFVLEKNCYTECDCTVCKIPPGTYIHMYLNVLCIIKGPLDAIFLGIS